MIKSDTKRKQIKTMFAMLKAYGAKEINISFDGSGDSGSIDSVNIYNGEKNINPDFSVEYTETSSRYSDGKWVETHTSVIKPVKDALEMVCYDMLQETGIDWYNNDGGFGELRVDLDSGEVGLEVNSRYTEYNTDTFNFNEDLEEKEE